MCIRELGGRSVLRSTIWLLVAFLVCLSGRCIGQTHNDFTYSVSGRNVTVTAYRGSGDAPVIPASIPAVGVVTSIGDECFFCCTNLTNITIPNSVTSIGFSAFFLCTNLTSITIPDTVNCIGTQAFVACSSLTSINIPRSATRIPVNAFHSCTSLRSIAIPNSVTSIDAGAFFRCTSLRSIMIPNSVTSIGEGAFAYCSNLTSITIPDSVTSIGDNAFDGCTSLASPYFQASAPGLTLILGVGAVSPSFNHLRLGASYQLQVSTDLNAWSDTEGAFTATNSGELYTPPFNVKSYDQLFFRLRSAP